MSEPASPVHTRRPDEQRVVVTGMGAVTPLGADRETSFRAMQAGRSGITRMAHFDPTGLPCEIAGQVDAAWLAPEDAAARRGGTEYRLARPALDAAVSEAELAAVADRRRIAMVLGGHARTPSVDEIRLLADHVDADGNVDFASLAGETRYDDRTFDRRVPDTVPGLLARHVDAQGPSLGIVSACAAGTQAIGEGLRLIRDGLADVVVCGGAEPLVSYAGFLGFGILGALTRRYPSPEGASRPFDRRRNGFVIAEGAGLLVLERLSHARARGVSTIHGEILGYGDSSDAFGITEPHPRGEGAVQAMQAALDDARCTAASVDYVNAHGTSTPKNDPIETQAIKRVLGERALQIPVSSNKSMIGHTIGAAGALEAIVTLMGMQRGVVLPTINQEVPDPKCDLDYVPNEAREHAHRLALSNSFGFGGQNGCLCLGAFA